MFESFRIFFMRKIIATLFLTIIYFLISPDTYAVQVAGNSAAITYNVSNDIARSRQFIKKLAIRRVLEKYSAPLADSTDDFINTCTTYDLDCYLLPSISGLESTFGRFLLPNSYNPFGWGGGYIMFKNWAEGINTVAYGLRNNYLNKGANTIEDIGRIYSESPTWAVRVQYFINEFQGEEDKLQLLLNKDQVKL